MKPSRPRFQLREVLLLLVPVLALAGFGAYFVLHPSASPTAGWAIVVDDVKVEPATPREVAMGYDTKVVFHASEKGKSPAPKPSHAELSVGLAPTFLWAQRNGKRVNLSRDVPDAQRPKLYLSSGMNDGLILMKLASIPTDAGQLDLETGIEMTQRWKDANGVNTIKAQTSPVVVTVRRAGEKIKTPVVSKYRPFVVKKFAIDNNMRSLNSILDQLVVLEVQGGEDATNLDPKAPLLTEETYLLDGKGRKYDWLKQPNGSLQGAAQVVASRRDDKTGIYYLKYNVAISQIPASAGKLTLHTRVSMDNCWPLDLSLVVREK